MKALLGTPVSNVTRLTSRRPTPSQDESQKTAGLCNR